MSKESQPPPGGDLPFAFGGIAPDRRNAIESRPLTEEMPLIEYVSRSLRVLPLLDSYLGDQTLEQYADQLFSAPEKKTLSALTGSCMRKSSVVIAGIHNNSIGVNRAARRLTLQGFVGATLSGFAAIPWLHAEAKATEGGGSWPDKLMIPDLLRLPHEKQPLVAHLVGSAALAYVTLGVGAYRGLLEECSEALQTPSKSVFRHTRADLEKTIKKYGNPEEAVRRFFNSGELIKPKKVRHVARRPNSVPEGQQSRGGLGAARHNKKIEILRSNPDINQAAVDLEPGQPPLLLHEGMVKKGDMGGLITSYAELILGTMYERRYDTDNPPEPQWRSHSDFNLGAGGWCSRLHLYIPGDNDRSLLKHIAPLKPEANLSGVRQVLFAYAIHGRGDQRSIRVVQVDLLLKEHLDETGRPSISLMRRLPNLRTLRAAGLAIHFPGALDVIMPAKES
jgi:hypothetical protein